MFTPTRITGSLWLHHLVHPDYNYRCTLITSTGSLWLYSVERNFNFVQYQIKMAPRDTDRIWKRIGKKSEVSPCISTNFEWQTFSNMNILYMRIQTLCHRIEKKINQKFVWLSTLIPLQFENRLWTVVVFHCCTLIWGLTNNNYNLYLLQFMTVSVNIHCT
jgi:hypothetical protein